MRLLRAISIIFLLSAFTSPAGAQTFLQDTAFARVLSADLRRLQDEEARCRSAQSDNDGYGPGGDGPLMIDPGRVPPSQSPRPPLHTYRVDWAGLSAIRYTPSWGGRTYRYTGTVSVRLSGVSGTVEVPPPPSPGPWMNDPRMPVDVVARDSTLTFSYSLALGRPDRFRGPIRLRLEMALTEMPGGMFASTCDRPVQLSVMRWYVYDGDVLEGGDNRPYDANPLRF